MAHFTQAPSPRSPSSPRETPPHDLYPDTPSEFASPRLDGSNNTPIGRQCSASTDPFLARKIFVCPSSCAFQLTRSIGPADNRNAYEHRPFPADLYNLMGIDFQGPAPQVHRPVVASDDTAPTGHGQDGREGANHSEYAPIRPEDMVAPEPPSNRYYMVAVGRGVGIYTNW